MGHHPISWLLCDLCSVFRILGLMLIIFASLYLMVHGLWCSEPIRKGLALPFEELGQLTRDHRGAALVLGVRGLEG